VGDALKAQHHESVVTHCSCCNQAISRLADTAANDGASPPLSFAVVPRPLQLHTPTMLGAEQAEPGLAAAAMLQLLQQEQQWQAMLQQQQLQAVCTGCLKKRMIWGQLVS
jgi:hypothetical protein